MKKLSLAFVVLSLLSALLVACGSSTTTSTTTGNNDNSNSGNTATVHMTDNNFAQPGVTISKGSSINLVNDAAVVHIINNGSWVNGNSKSAKESGAPTVNVQFNGNDSHTVGPFNTVGTYHLYCTVHTGMNLTVIVQ
ncbi:MAG: plastocyanin/azurin family copper-binding protein [Ktedonobacteraceae bacterium]